MLYIAFVFISVLSHVRAFAITGLARHTPPFDTFAVNTKHALNASYPKFTRDLVRRADGDGKNEWPEEAKEEWDKANKIGCNLYAAMSSIDSKAAEWVRGKEAGTAASPFTEYKAFEEWGYVKDEFTETDYADEGPELVDCFRDLGIDPRLTKDGGSTAAIGFLHAEETLHEGLKYPATNAEFRTLINLNAGVIVAWTKYGPKYRGSIFNPPVTALPKLKNWHDVAFLKWQKVAQDQNKDIKNLRYIFSTMISNNESKELIELAVGLSPYEKEDCLKMQWAQRQEFLPETEAYQVLIASPNGRGAALLLITHKSTFGERNIIQSVTVFCSMTEVHLMFTIGEE